MGQRLKTTTNYVVADSTLTPITLPVLNEDANPKGVDVVLVIRNNESPAARILTLAPVGDATESTLVIGPGDTVQSGPWEYEEVPDLYQESGSPIDCDVTVTLSGAV